MRKRDTVFAMPQFLTGEGSGAEEPTASLDDHGRSLTCRALMIHCVKEDDDVRPNPAETSWKIRSEGEFVSGQRGSS